MNVGLSIKNIGNYLKSSNQNSKTSVDTTSTTTTPTLINANSANINTHKSLNIKPNSTSAAAYKYNTTTTTSTTTTNQILNSDNLNKLRQQTSNLVHRNNSNPVQSYSTPANLASVGVTNNTHNSASKKRDSSTNALPRIRVNN